MKLLVATVWSGLISAAAALADTRRSRSGAYRRRCSDMAGAAATECALSPAAGIWLRATLMQWSLASAASEHAIRNRCAHHQPNAAAKRH
ncbi:hypothetical protein VC273_17225 [Xanthomonas nasturtii]|uniref:hypothetical protein n=1 Tax=unclassified Xanthomonas TaxID=2643310 RepID=UPI002B3F2203|nr:hypothetical protein [Xanthomonas nasturtii]